MRAALIFLLLAAPAAAHDGGEPITFRGRPPRIIVTSLPGLDGVIWESGPSDPLRASYTTLLFQGRSTQRNFSVEASLLQDGRWQPWTAAEIERFASGRFWGKIELAGAKHSSLRLRFLGRQTAPGVLIKLFSLEAARPETEKPSASASQAPSPAPAPAPEILTREQWQARPATEPYEAMLPARLTIHHTDTDQPLALEDAVEEMRAIQHFHQSGRGWIDIGYHFLIDGSGRIFRGRPEAAVGAHVRDHNPGNVGVALMGGFQAPSEQRPTDSQLKSAAALARWLVGAYGIDPDAIKGHRDQRPTDCPGDALYALLGEIKRAAKEPGPAPAPRLWRAPLLPEALARPPFDSRSRR